MSGAHFCEKKINLAVPFPISIKKLLNDGV